MGEGEQPGGTTPPGCIFLPSTEVVVSEPLKIRLREHGPLVIEGAVRIVDHRGNEFPLPKSDKKWVALCRCGQSKTKPFCDGTHKQCGFEAAELAPEPPKADG